MSARSLQEVVADASADPATCQCLEVLRGPGFDPRHTSASSPEQRGDVFRLFLTSTSSEEVWGQPTADMARRYYQSHLNADAVRLAAAMYGLEVPHASTKQALVDELVRKELPLPDLDSLLRWRTRAFSISPGPAAELPQGGDRSDRDLRESKSDGDDTSIQTFMARLIEAARGASTVPTAEPLRESAETTHINKARARISNYQYQEIAELSEAYVGNIRRKQPVTAPPHATKIGNVWMLTNYQPTRDVSRDMNVANFRSGCDRFLELVIEAQMPHQYSLQVHKFFRLVWAHEGARDEDKINYIREFTSRLEGNREWAKEYRTNYQLMSQYLTPPRDRHLPSAPARSADAAPRKRKAGAQRQRARGLCHAYALPTNPPCRYPDGKCAFSHVCASCQGDHEAASCPHPLLKFTTFMSRETSLVGW